MTRLAQLRSVGPDALEALPDREDLAKQDRRDRDQRLDELRIELYALSAIVAEAIVARARGDRGSYPPYGVARSMFSEWGMLKMLPEPYEQGSITTFLELWKALVDTMVLHMHRELGAQRESPQAWVVERLDALVPLFAAAGDRRTAARLADTQTFLYGGLQFGTSVCVQLAEVMSRLLSAQGVAADEQRAVLARSHTPAHRLAAMSQAAALETYRGLLSRGPDTPAEGRDRPGWLDAGRFVVQQHDGAPSTVVMGDGREGEGVAGAYTPLGCPARVAPTAEQTSIAALWRWCVDLSADTGLLAARVSRG